MPLHVFEELSKFHGFKKTSCGPGMIITPLISWNFMDHLFRIDTSLYDKKRPVYVF